MYNPDKCQQTKGDKFYEELKLAIKNSNAVNGVYLAEVYLAED